jgi:multiple sugar transport system ATP-binding protein
MAGLSIRRAQKLFGATAAVHDFSLDVGDGEFVTLLGPSGCGKTTLLRLVAGLETLSAGEIVLDGRTIHDLAPSQRNIAMVFQSYALYPHKTVAENIAFPLLMQAALPLRIPGLRRLAPGCRELDRRIADRVDPIARMLQIAHLLSRKPAQLSGGQRQRVALARAMVRAPRLFLMDEPLSNLDARLRSSTRAEIVDLHRRLKTTFIYVTHDQSEAMTMSDRIALMHEGRIQQVGTPVELYEDPNSLFVAEFIGQPRINVLPLRFEGGAATLAGQAVRNLPAHVDGVALPRGDVRIGLRPEAFVLSEPGDAQALVGRVHLLESLGNETHIRLALGDVEITVRAQPGVARGLSIGQPLAVRPAWSSALVFDETGMRAHSDRLRAAA